MIVTLYLSDLHLGTDVCSARHLFKFLKTFEREDGRYDLKELVLAGDIIDFMAMRKRNCWDDTHTAVIQKVLKMARKGVKVVYVSGNHDFHLEFLDGTDYGNIHVCKEYVKTTLNGERVLVTHGHQFDGLIFKNKHIYMIGDFLYDVALKMNKWCNMVRWLFKKDAWSLSMWLKGHVKSALAFVCDVERLISEEACRKLCNIVVYGHTHMARDRMIGTIRVLNCGCFTEYASAVTEDENGVFKVVDVDVEYLQSQKKENV